MTSVGVLGVEQLLCNLTKIITWVMLGGNAGSVIKSLSAIAIKS